MTALDVWVATFLFGFQIYCDFAGYSDIAIGSARVLGLRFPENFDWPYMATSPKDFWKRWHISLSAWIRDYLYLPLTGQPFRTRSVDGIDVAAGGSGQGKDRALVGTWFIMGLWHGAGWNFAIWGLYHALVIYLYRVIKPLGALPRKAPALAWAVLLPISMASWIPFRAHSVEQTVSMCARLLDPSAYTAAGRAVAGYSYLAVTLLVVAMLISRLVDRGMPRLRLAVPLRSAATAVTMAVMVAAVLMLMRDVKQFIYFQF
jgi:D-alanyl-lipoteichoic acid acyltransferase DltB (MBOAT superfamily)